MVGRKVEETIPVFLESYFAQISSPGADEAPEGGRFNLWAVPSFPSALKRHLSMCFLVMIFLSSGALPFQAHRDTSQYNIFIAGRRLWRFHLSPLGSDLKSSCLDYLFIFWSLFSGVYSVPWEWIELFLVFSHLFSSVAINWWTFFWRGIRSLGL